MPSSSDNTTANDQSSVLTTIVVSGGSSSAYDNSHIDAAMTASDDGSASDAGLSYEAGSAAESTTLAWTASNTEGFGFGEGTSLEKSLTSQDTATADASGAFYHASSDTISASDFTPSTEGATASESRTLLRSVTGSDSVTAAQAAQALSRVIGGYDAFHVSGYRQIGVFPRSLYPGRVFAPGAFGWVASKAEGEYSLSVVPYFGDDDASLSVEVGFSGKYDSNQIGVSENVASLAISMTKTDSAAAAEYASLMLSVQGSQTASASESTQLSLAVVAAEAGGTTEASSLQKAASASETASAVESSIVYINMSGVDSASAFESAQLSLSVPATEVTGTTEASSLQKAIPASDSASTVESSVIYAGLSATDAASTSEDSYVALSVSRAESILAAESRSLLRTLASSDAASLADIGIYIALSDDQGQAVEALLAYARTLYNADAVFAAESAEIGRLASQASSAADASALAWSVAGGESGSSTETGNLYLAVSANDAASASESAMPKNTFAVDLGGASESVASLSTAISNADSASQSESSAYVTVVYESAAASETSSLATGKSVADALLATESTGAFFRSTGDSVVVVEASAIARQSTATQSAVAADVAAVVKIIAVSDAASLDETSRSLGFVGGDVFGSAEQSSNSTSLTIGASVTASESGAVVFAFASQETAAAVEASSQSRSQSTLDAALASESVSCGWTVTGDDDLAMDGVTTIGPFNKFTFVPRIYPPKVYAPASSSARTSFHESAFVVWSLAAVDAFTAVESGSSLILTTIARERIGVSESSTLTKTTVGVDGVHATDVASVFQYIPISSSDAAVLAEAASLTTTPELADIWGAIHAWFVSSGLTSSFPGGLWLGFAPSATPMPYIVVDPSSAMELFQSCTEYRVEMQPFIMKVYASGAEQCRVLGKSVERKYNHAKLPLQGDYVMAMLRRGRQLKYVQPQKTKPIGKAFGFVDAWVDAINYDCFIGRNQGAMY